MGLAVLDRSGRRLGTVYLGHMPEPGQGILSQQLTALLTAVLNDWQGPLPRLQYVTDGGHHPSEYFATVLQTMLHPRTGKPLEWEWVVDYYHACLYVTKLAEALFGKETKEAASWAAKMRRWLKDKKSGILRVLHSAAAHAWRLELGATGVATSVFLCFRGERERFWSINGLEAHLKKAWEHILTVV